MNQNQGVLVVVAIVAIGIIAAFLLLSNQGGPRGVVIGGNEAEGGAYGAPESNNDGNDGNVPSSTGEGESGQAVSNDVLNALSSGTPVECIMTIDLGEASGDPSLNGQTSTTTIEIQGQKIRASGSIMGVEYIEISDGENLYLNYGGSDWYLLSSGSEVPTQSEIPTAESIRESLQSMPAGVSLDCHVVAGFPPSDFMLPPGVVPKSIEDLQNQIMQEEGIQT